MNAISNAVSSLHNAVKKENERAEKTGLNQTSTTRRRLSVGTMILGLFCALTAKNVVTNLLRDPIDPVGVFIDNPGWMVLVQSDYSPTH